MNPKAGNHSVERFDLNAKAEQLGAQVLLTTAEQSAAALARSAVDGGARRLGVAGGDGTVAAVAAVAADAKVPLIVIPAGTRNHFARDLGLDVKNPERALVALAKWRSVDVDLGVVQSRVFVNNVSFGVYADALLEPGYREAKARSFVSITGPYLEGQRWVDATVHAPAEAIDEPQVVLVSNNPYHLATLRSFGHRFALNSGLLGAIVIKRQPEPPPPALVAELRRELRRNGRASVPGSGVVVWSATEVTLAGAHSTLLAGVDGELVQLVLPVTCRAWPGALTVHSPVDRAGARSANWLPN